jgi:alpha-tubulin suppressor-like RCC1 family protein
MCWGYNSNAQVGDQTMVDRVVPTPVLGLPGPIAGLEAGALHSCAVSTAGVLTCWGTTAAVQPPSAVPVVIPLPGPVRDVGAGLFVTCAVLAGPGALAGTLWCWGANAGGSYVGNGSTTGAVSSPVQLAFDAGVRQVVGGWSHLCALLDDGRAFCWGANGQGQLGVDAGSASATPVEVTVDGGLVSLTARGDVSCGQRVDGRVVCWGDNLGSAIAAGGVDQSVPVDHHQVTEPVAAVAVGAWTSYFHLLDGGLDCTGSLVGLCGSSSFSVARRQVPGVPSATLVRGGTGFACAELPDAGVACWGQGLFGQTGTGVDAGLVPPTRPTGL